MSSNTLNVTSSSSSLFYLIDCCFNRVELSKAKSGLAVASARSNMESVPILVLPKSFKSMSHSRLSSL